MKVLFKVSWCKYKIFGVRRAFLLVMTTLEVKDENVIQLYNISQYK